MTNKLIIITGQTATGKTKLALEYAQKYNGELINCDSRQIYKYLNIITGKDINKIANSKFKIVNRINNFDIGFYSISTSFNKFQPISTKIWLYDVVYPDQYFSSFEYIKLAQKVIKDIISRNKTPILVGGSYFYLKHLLYGFDFQVPPNFKLREELNKKSVSELQQILTNLITNHQTPISNLQPLNQSDWQNPRRLIRRIEILQGTLLKKTVPLRIVPKFSISKFIGLKYKNKETLKQAITDRVEERLEQGAIDEIKTILKKGYKENNPGLKTIGYKQIIEYLEEKITQEDAIKKWITAEVQYAKRQYTFMKKDKNILWNII